MRENLRADLIKQFPAEVIEVVEKNDKRYYACPTCKRAIARSDMKCVGCSQVLSWNNMKKEEVARMEPKTATLTFEVPGDFSKSDCRKCPLSYIAKTTNGNVYECPLNKKTGCPLVIS